jgi:hypothetical protein
VSCGELALLHITTRARATADGYDKVLLPSDASFLGILFSSDFPAASAIPVAFKNLSALANFIREMRPGGIEVAVAEGEDRAAISAALDELAASGGTLH